MTHDEVITKLSRECCLAIGDFSYFTTVKVYIQRALTIGIEHYTVDMEEVVVMDAEGREVGRFKSVSDASRKIGVRQSDISAVLAGRQHTTGGFMFILAKDYLLKSMKLL